MSRGTKLALRGSTNKARYLDDSRAALDRWAELHHRPLRVFICRALLVSPAPTAFKGLVRCFAPSAVSIDADQPRRQTDW